MLTCRCHVCCAMDQWATNSLPLWKKPFGASALNLRHWEPISDSASLSEWQAKIPMCSVAPVPHPAFHLGCCRTVRVPASCHEGD